MTSILVGIGFACAGLAGWSLHREVVDVYACQESGGPERGHRDKRFYTLGDDANGYFARKWQDALGTILKPQPF